MSFDELKKKWNRENRLDKNVYRLKYNTFFGRLESSQIEKRWRAEKLKQLQEHIPGIKNIQVAREHPDKLQKFRRNLLKKKTGYLEFMVGT